eukprot:106826-Chlamydomonas_euryale.AAC.4
MSSATTAARAATVGLLTLPKLPNGGPPMPPLLGPGLAAATATPRRPAPPALHPEMTAAALLHGCGRDEAAVPAVEKVGATRPCAGRVGTAADAAAAGGAALLRGKRHGRSATTALAAAAPTAAAAAVSAAVSAAAAVEVAARSGRRAARADGASAAEALGSRLALLRALRLRRVR